jgi:hypothetical protein
MKESPQKKMDPKAAQDKIPSPFLMDRFFFYYKPPRISIRSKISSTFDLNQGKSSTGRLFIRLKNATVPVFRVRQWLLNGLLSPQSHGERREEISCLSGDTDRQKELCFKDYWPKAGGTSGESASHRFSRKKTSLSALPACRQAGVSRTSPRPLRTSGR